MTVGAAPSSAQGAPLYASVAGRVASLGQDEVVFYDVEANRSHVMTAQVVEALNLCRSFRTMDEHVATVASKIAGLQGQQAAVKRVLESLATRGLMVSDDAFLQRFVNAPRTAPGPHAGLFVRACDRPDQLAALLDSLPADGGDAELVERVVVVDDSRDAAVVGAHAEALQRAAARTGRQVVHVTPERWSQLTESLAAELPEHAQAIRSMLRHDPAYRGPRGGGQGRNLVTLLAAGSRYLLLDDDNRFPLAMHPQAQSVLDHEGRAWGVHTFADLQAAFDSGIADPSGLATQLELCGRSLGELVANGTVRMDRAALAGRVPSQDPLLRGDLRVAMTVTGHRGGSCSSGVSWMLLLDPRARAGHSATPEVYARRRGDAAVWFGCASYTPTRMANFTPFAVDNSHLMPCTSPFGRGEDAVFNALASAADSSTVQLHVPWSIGHLPESGRDRSALYDQPDTTDLNLCFADLVMRCTDEIQAQAPAARLAAVAARLEDLSAADERGIIAYLTEFQAYRRSSLIAHMQAMLQAAPDTPAWVFDDLRRQIEANGRAVVARGVPRFAGWPENITAAECAATFRAQALALAAGLRAWPDLWAAAEQRSAGWLAQLGQVG